MFVDVDKRWRVVRGRWLTRRGKVSWPVRWSEGHGRLALGELWPGKEGNSWDKPSGREVGRPGAEINTDRREERDLATDLVTMPSEAGSDDGGMLENSTLLSEDEFWERPAVEDGGPTRRKIGRES